MSDAKPLVPDQKTLIPESLLHDYLWHYIPVHMRRHVRDYLLHGYEPGHFLSAVLKNDFMEACSRADTINLHNLPGYVQFLFNGPPPASYGSPENFAAWIKAGKKLRGQQ